MVDETLTRAVVVWSGRGTHSWPHRDDQRVIAEFGPDAGIDLLHAVHLLEDDFYRSEARFDDSDLAQIGDRAAADFRILHPEIGYEGVEALTWCYTFDYK